MASYQVRAIAIHDLVTTLRRILEQNVDTTPSNKVALISVSVEVVNKLLYCFLLSQEMFDKIDELLNDHIMIGSTPQATGRLYLRVLSVVRSLERKASGWVRKYS